ncbi:hypothetical protein EEJ42_04845 [Streptomyces botrytidirepellens]|uniref:Uncharacterized protein n=1 Tax=Streptomyces botrytidirepellens TaxID=2486417 RepID=A0A3M8WXJ4_9ACTN|nr:hypothetical protein EEJ42_04845 [Streptomyces botrytidirepellens]
MLRPGEDRQLAVKNEFGDGSPGRPRAVRSVRALVLRLARENPDSAASPTAPAPTLCALG